MVVPRPPPQLNHQPQLRQLHPEPMDDVERILEAALVTRKGVTVVAVHNMGTLYNFHLRIKCRDHSADLIFV
jgi:hypothetical protein